MGFGFGFDESCRSCRSKSVYTSPWSLRSFRFALTVAGSVTSTAPFSEVKANLKLRSDQGDVYTDFDLQLRQDSSDPNPNVSIDLDRPRGDNARQRVDDARRRVEVDKAIYGSINGGGPDFEMRTFNGNVYVRKGK